MVRSAAHDQKETDVITTALLTLAMTQSQKPSPRTDKISMIAHDQLVQKAKSGRIDLYFLGDSITRRWGTSDAIWKQNYDNWIANFYGWNAGNFGWGADETKHMLWRIQNGELDGVHPRVIVLQGGTNNIGAGQSADQVFKGLFAIIETCRAKAPMAKIVVTGVFYRNDNMAFVPVVSQVNTILQKYAESGAIHYLDVNDGLADSNGKLFPGMTIDNLHLSPKGYQVWADGLIPILTRLLGPKSDKDIAPPPTGDPSQKPAKSS
ncbi:MAG TPA: GDSL-type esterase/lipase family protein [Fimbriimonas sp.]|nr:GDSL-type esterase/lipase family protein [Fimbriimonas sp.]